MSLLEQPESSRSGDAPHRSVSHLAADAYLVGESAAKDIWKFAKANPLEATFIAGLAVAAASPARRFLNSSNLSGLHVLESPIELNLTEAISSNKFGMKMAAPHTPTYTERLLEGARVLTEKAFYKAPASRALDLVGADLQTLDRKGQISHIRHNDSPVLMSDSLESVMRQSMKQRNVAGEKDLDALYRPIIEKRYAGKTGIDVLEIGPSDSLAMPKTFASAANLRSYTAVDNSLPYLEALATPLGKFGTFDKTLIRADAARIPVEAASKDIVVSNATPPFQSDPPREMRLAYEEAARVLKPGGELIITPFRYSPQVHPFLKGLFEPVYAAEHTVGSQRRIAMVFKRL